MRVFFGGQIKEECRGDLAAVITRNKDSQKYSSFLYPIISDEFVHLTGMGTVHENPERVYIGVSREAGEILQVSNDNNGEVDFRGLDKLVVTAHFVDSNIDKPKNIILKPTQDNGIYRVVTEAK
jgi:hypothetical protein